MEPKVVKVIRSDPVQTEDEKIIWHLEAVKSYFDRTTTTGTLWLPSIIAKSFVDDRVISYHYGKRLNYQTQPASDIIQLLYFGIFGLRLVEFTDSGVTIRNLPPSSLLKVIVNQGIVPNSTKYYCEISISSYELFITLSDNYEIEIPTEVNSFVHRLHEYQRR